MLFRSPDDVIRVGETELVFSAVDTAAAAPALASRLPKTDSRDPDAATQEQPGVPGRELAALQQLTRIDQDRHVAWVAQPAVLPGTTEEPSPLVADARYVRADDPEEAEFAVAVADAWQRQGLARSLLCLLARHAARRGIRRLAGDVLVENTPMLALLRSLGGELRWRAGEPGMVRAALAL